MADDRQVAVDEMVARVLAAHPLRFAIATGADERAVAYRLRTVAIDERGWTTAGADGVDRDEFDDRAIVLVGWDADEPVATGRLVLPPGPLPTEVACGVVVEPEGRVVDVGRMVVVPSRRAWHRGAFVALLAALHAQMRREGYDTATGLMARDVRTLARILGLTLDVLGPERLWHGAMRAPVRFSCADNEPSLRSRWSDPDGAPPT